MCFKHTEHAACLDFCVQSESDEDVKLPVGCRYDVCMSRTGSNAEALRGRSNQKLSWLWVAISVFGISWGGNQFSPMLVFYHQDNVLDSVFINSLMFIYALGMVPSLLIAGPLSDRYGRKPVMLFAPVFIVLGSILLASGQTFGPLLALGRFISGLAVGIAMSVGGSWVKELSQAPFDPSAKDTSGAKRQAMASTLGFALGGGGAAAMAQWLPLPGQLPYLIHILIILTTVGLLFAVPETRQSAHLRTKGSFWRDVRTPSVLHPRFLTVVATTAPWVFGCGGVAYAIMPTLTTHLTDYPLANAGLMSIVALGVGFITQQFAPYLVDRGSARGLIVAMIAVIIAMSATTYINEHLTFGLSLVAVVLLGIGYGLTLFNGLNEVQRIAGPSDLAGLSGIFYIIAYIGFAFPAILEKLHELNDFFTYTRMFAFGAVMAAVSLVIVLIFSKRNIPA